MNCPFSMYNGIHINNVRVHTVHSALKQPVLQPRPEIKRTHIPRALLVLNYVWHAHHDRRVSSYAKEVERDHVEHAAAVGDHPCARHAAQTHGHTSRPWQSHHGAAYAWTCISTPVCGLALLHPALTRNLQVVRRLEQLTRLHLSGELRLLCNVLSAHAQWH